MGKKKKNSLPIILLTGVHPAWQSKDACYAFTMHVETKYRSVAPTQSMRDVELVSSLTSAVRRYTALCKLWRSPLCKDILCPSPESTLYTNERKTSSPVVSNDSCGFFVVMYIYMICLLSFFTS